MPPSETATQGSPLAPSVEKAYYRKCIELKRRLNETEAANDEMRVKRVRLDRAVMKMRLERAFLLDEVRKRMEHNVDESEGSGDEGMATPPPNRPHRDRSRRPLQPAASSQPPAAHPHHLPPPPEPYAPYQRSDAGPPPSTAAIPGPDVPLVDGPNGTKVRANAMNASGQYVYEEDLAHASEVTQSTSLPPPPPPYSHPPLAHGGSPYNVPIGVPGAGRAAQLSVNGMKPDELDDREQQQQQQQQQQPQPPPPRNREVGAIGEALSAGPATREEPSGERRILSPGGATNNANMESDQKAGFSSVVEQ